MLQPKKMRSMIWEMVMMNIVVTWGELGEEHTNTQRRDGTQPGHDDSSHCMVLYWHHVRQQMAANTQRVSLGIADEVGC